MSRFFGGRSLTTRPPMLTVPPLIGSSPAIIRRAEVLPQPDGPTKHDELAVGDLEVELGHRFRPVRIDLRQPVELDLPP